MVVKVVEPELQGPDTAGMENQQGKKDTVKIYSPHSSSLFCHKKCGWIRAFTKCGLVNLRERTVAQSHQYSLITETQPVTEHLHGITCATVTPNNHVWSKIPHCSAPMSLIEFHFAETRLLWERQTIFKTKTCWQLSPNYASILCQWGRAGSPCVGRAERSLF